MTPVYRYVTVIFLHTYAAHFGSAHACVHAVGMRALSLAVSRCKWKPCFRDASRLYPSLTPAAFFSAASRAVRTAPCLNSVSLPIPQSPRFLHSSSRCKTAEISRTRQVRLAIYIYFGPKFQIKPPSYYCIMWMPQSIWDR